MENLIKERVKILYKLGKEYKPTPITPDVD
jgi:hypothetical protein